MLCPNVATLLWERTRLVPEQSAVIERDSRMTYAELGARARAVTDTIRAAGATPGDRVALFLERGGDAAAALFGALASGAVAVMINETLRPRQIEHIVTHSGARLLIATRELLDRQPRALETAATVLDVGDSRATGSGDPVPRIGSDFATILYTSGSTGPPKGVTITHANLWAGVWAVTSYLGITGDDRIASLLPFSFGYGLSQLFLAVAAGATLVVERSPVANHMGATLRSCQVTVLAAVPPLWLQLLSAPEFAERPLASLRAMTCAGGKMPVEAVRRLRQVQPQAQLFLMYGLTEAFRGTYLPPEEVDRRPSSMGKAIPGAEILVLREDGTPCGVGEVGELVQRGPTVAAGYWNDPEATAARFRPDPLRPPGGPDAERVVYSGDLVRADADGFLYYVGRRDRMIKSLGFRVSPDEVAEVLYASGEIVEAVVDSEPDEQRGERIVAYVVLKHDGSLERLLAFAKIELPRYQQPARFETREHLPRLPSGKFDLTAVRSE